MKTMRAIAMGCMFAAGAVMIAGTADAQPGRGERPGPDFSLTFEQAQERWPNLTRERFDRMDTDGDGVLTPADRIGRGDRPGRPGASGRPGPGPDFSLTFEQAQERWPNLTRERFDRMDTDGDGVLTPADRIGRGDRPGRPGREGPVRQGPPARPEAGDDEAKLDEGDDPAPRRFEGRPRGERPRDGEGFRDRPRGERGEGDVNPRGDRRPRDGRGPAPAE
jgi:hypothetical protein